MQQIPRHIIWACIRGGYQPLRLYDMKNGVTYHGELRKMKKSVERYVCGGWADFCKDKGLKEGDTPHFMMRPTLVTEILVVVECGLVS